MPRVVSVSHVRDFVLRIRFADGTEGEMNFADELDGEIFEPLHDLAYFRQVRVDPDVHTIVWPNGADFAPDFLYERVRVHA